MNHCFNCGAPLPLNSIVCKECGFSPNLEFIRKCPNLGGGAKCVILGQICKHKGAYQLCSTKNKADRECGY